ncbi:MAG TPA: hypothetical protein VF548_15250 [Allosphingosinicella sp.]
MAILPTVASTLAEAFRAVGGEAPSRQSALDFLRLAVGKAGEMGDG